MTKRRPPCDANIDQAGRSPDLHTAWCGSLLVCRGEPSRSQPVGSGEWGIEAAGRLSGKVEWWEASGQSMRESGTGTIRPESTQSRFPASGWSGEPSRTYGHPESDRPSRSVSMIWRDSGRRALVEPQAVVPLPLRPLPRDACGADCSGSSDQLGRMIRGRGDSAVRWIGEMGPTIRSAVKHLARGEEVVYPGRSMDVFPE
jgi:hypothetical protein